MGSTRSEAKAEGPSPPSELVKKFVIQELITAVDSGLMERRVSAKIAKLPHDFISAEDIIGQARQLLRFMWRRTLESPTMLNNIATEKTERSVMEEKTYKKEMNFDVAAVHHFIPRNVNNQLMKTCVLITIRM